MEGAVALALPPPELEVPLLEQLTNVPMRAIEVRKPSVRTAWRCLRAKLEINWAIAVVETQCCVCKQHADIRTLDRPVVKSYRMVVAEMGR